MTPLSLSFSQRALEWATALVRHLPLGAEPALPASATRIDYLLYCSSAIQAFQEQQLADLLEQARAYNKRHNITGLLCYNEGHFVQVIEGEPDKVSRLFARIAGDPRHHHVKVLRRGSSSDRKFKEWGMVFVKTESQDFYGLISSLEAHHYRLLLPQVPIPESGLLPLLRTFSRTCTDMLPRPSALQPSYAGLLPFL